MTKYIFVTGGVVSGIGKGISAASIGRLLKDAGFSVFMQKFDPYINFDPGTLSPYQHGEVFVTRDGGETDLDLGHYERFIDEELTMDSSVTSGKIYYSVISKEREGFYGGSTVQVIPHITDEIKGKVYKVAEESGADIVITEIGGTVGDIESLPFIEAIRQIHAENEKNDVLFIHTTLVPAVPGGGELKTKPTQHSYKQLMSYGIKPNIFVLRADSHIDDGIRKKISLFCDVPVEAIIQSENCELIYEVPLLFKEQKIDQYIARKLNLAPKKDDTGEWARMVQRFKKADYPIKIGVVGKYIQLPDAYLSVNQGLLDAGYNQGAKVELVFIDSECLTPETVKDQLGHLDGIMVPGGFGKRGVEGMILASKYARDHKIPYFGICLGMQIACIDMTRDLLGLSQAHSTEFDPDTPHPVIDLMPDQKNLKDLGGTLRLGDELCTLKPGSKVHALYGAEEILERHRHRYEFNNAYKADLEDKGVVFSGINRERGLVEMLELQDHPYFVACQAHPEFKSRPNRPHPLFAGFVAAAINYKMNR